MKRFLHITLLLCTMLLTTTEISAWKFTKVTPENNTQVSSLKTITLSPDQLLSDYGIIPYKLSTPKGKIEINFDCTSWDGTITVNLEEQTAPGSYKLIIEEGTFHYMDPNTWGPAEGNEYQEITWTIGDGGGETPGDGETPGGDNQGDDSGNTDGGDDSVEGMIHFYNAETAQNTPVSGNGITYSATNGGFMSAPAYQTYGGKSLWIYNRNTVTFTAQTGKLIDRIVFKTIAGYEGRANVNVGTFENGEWSYQNGAQSVTFEMTDNMHVTDIYISLIDSPSGGDGGSDQGSGDGNDDGNQGSEPQKPWRFSSVYPEEGVVGKLYELEFTNPSGINGEISGSAYLDLKKDDKIVAKYLLQVPQDNKLIVKANNPYDPNNYMSMSEIVVSGTYTLTIPGGEFKINNVENEEQTFTWIVKEEEIEPWEFTKLSPMEEIVDSIYEIKLSLPFGYTNELNSRVATLIDPNLKKHDFSLSNGGPNYVVGKISPALHTKGTYRLKIDADLFHEMNKTNHGNKEQEFTWTIPDPEYTDATDINFVAKNGKGYWATYSNNERTFILEPVKVYKVTAKEDISLVEIDSEYVRDLDVRGTHIPAKTGVLLFYGKEYPFTGNAPKATVKTVKYKYIESFSNNLLRPNSKNMGDKDLYYHKFYRLAYKDFKAMTGLGFYYGAGCSEGQAFVCKDGTAYLAVPELAGARSFYMFDEDDETTGVNNVNVNENENHDVYNLAGQRVAGSHKGIVIVNGKKVVK